MSARYVVLSAARPRSAWFGDVAQWANTGALALEFLKCLSADDVVAKANGPRACSAALLDGGMSGLDRDLFARLRERGLAVIIVHDPRVARDWRSLGAHAVLGPDLSKAELLDALADHCELVTDGTSPIDAFAQIDTATSPIRGTVVTVVGSGGAGTTTVAMALAESFGTKQATKGHTVLADFCLDAELAMLHDTQHISPGLQELTDAHRLSTPNPEQVRDMCFQVAGRSYDLLIGLRRRRLWSTIRPASCVQAVQSLSATYAAVIIDADADLEGEAETGSHDVEERNLLSRTAVEHADHVVAVGHASLKGLHGLCRVIGELCEFGVSPSQIHPVLNFAPKSARSRAGYTRALADLIGADTPVGPPTFISFQPVDDSVRAVAALPDGVVRPITTLLTQFGPREQSTPTRRFERVTPGFLRRAVGES